MIGSLVTACLLLITDHWLLVTDHRLHMRPLRFHIKTFGCRLNQAEADAFAAQFAARGWLAVARVRDADVVVIHSCAVTRTAEMECLRRCRRFSRRTPPPFVVLSGCVPEAAADTVLADNGISLIVPRAERENLVARVVAACASRIALNTAAPAKAICRTRPFLRVQDGCDFFCAYCIVPHTRGRPVSRPFATCLREARMLIEAGAREIVIAGCNTARYEDDGRRLPDLLRALAALPSIERLRIGSIEPGTVEREIADLMAETPTLCRQLHLPLQSGDDTVLRAMGRRYTTREFRAAAEYALARVPDLGLGSDVIAGFPGESDAHFNATHRFIASIPFSNLHVFPYSERPGTPAAVREDQIPRDVRKARTNELIALGQEQRQRFARGFIGRPVACLIERCDAAGVGSGWSSAYLPCRIVNLPPHSSNIVVSFIPNACEDDTLVGTAGARQTVVGAP